MADAGHEILGVDVNVDLVEKLNNGDLHIVNENGLADLARRVHSSGHLRVSERPEESDVFIIAVPTKVSETPSR
jgi:UDP-N-acetyl-D-mannosaminuronic acid dehydrogenase